MSSFKPWIEKLPQDFLHFWHLFLQITFLRLPYKFINTAFNLPSSKLTCLMVSKSVLFPNKNFTTFPWAPFSYYEDMVLYLSSPAVSQITSLICLPESLMNLNLKSTPIVGWYSSLNVSYVYLCSKDDFPTYGPPIKSILNYISCYYYKDIKLKIYENEI